MASQKPGEEGVSDTAEKSVNTEMGGSQTGGFEEAMWEVGWGRQGNEDSLYRHFTFQKFGCEMVEAVVAGSRKWAVLARGAITKCHRPGDLSNRHLFFFSSRGWKSEIEVPGWSVSGESSLPGL